MKFLPNAAAVSLLNGFVTSVKRLYIAAFVALGVTIGYGALVDVFINGHSTNIYVNQALIGGHFLLIFPTGWLMAMAVGSSLYGDIWRESYLLGKRFSSEEREETPEFFIDRSIPFLLERNHR